MSTEKTPQNELPPSTNLAMGMGLGFMSGFPAAILASEGLANPSTETEALTAEPKQWPAEAVDPTALAISLPLGTVIGGAMGWIAMRARQRGESFMGMRRHK